MKTATRKIAILISIFLIMIGAPCRSIALEGDIFSEAGFEQHLNKPLPLESNFIDEAGQLVRLRSYFGQVPVVLMFGYQSCPNLCPTTFIGINESLRKSGLQVNR